MLLLSSNKAKDQVVACASHMFYHYSQIEEQILIFDEQRKEIFVGLTLYYRFRLAFQLDLQMKQRNSAKNGRKLMT